jgi:hypothetical protein
MARQSGEIKIIGTVDDICFYKMEGKYYVRMKSSLTGKRFWKDKAFERSRQSCRGFGKANQLASKVYRSIEKEKRQYSIFCHLKTIAIALTGEGLGEEEVIYHLQQFLPEKEKTALQKKKKENRVRTRPFYLSVPPSLFAFPLYSKPVKRNKVYAPV